MQRQLNCFLTLLYNALRITESAMPVSATVCFAWYQCRKHCLQTFGQIAVTIVCLFVSSREATYGGGSGWSLEGRNNMMNCLLQSRLTENKTPSSSIHAPSFFKLIAVANNLQSTMQRMMHAQEPKWRIIAWIKWKTKTRMKRIVRMKTLSCPTIEMSSFYCLHYETRNPIGK